MSEDDVPMGDMRRLLTLMDTRDSVLDPNTAERLLNGELPVDDAPPDAKMVARVIALVEAAPTDAELAKQSEAVAVLAATIRHASVDAFTPRRTSMNKQRITQLAAAGTVGVMTLFGGLAAANALPGAAQSVASDMLAKVGVSVPSPNSHGGSHPDNRGQSTSHSTGASSSSSSSSSGKGSSISDLARDTPATGVDKGATISGAASNGASQAGAPHSQAGTVTPDASAPVSTPPVPAPPVPTPPVATPPVPAGSGDASGGLAHKP